MISTDYIELAKYQPPKTTLGWEDWVRGLHDIKTVIEYWTEDVQFHLAEIESVEENLTNAKNGIRNKSRQELHAVLKEAMNELKHGRESIQTLLEHLEEKYLMDLEYLANYVKD